MCTVQMCRKRLVFVKISTIPMFYSGPMFFIFVMAMMTVQIDGYMESAEFISDLDRPGNYLLLNILFKYWVYAIIFRYNEKVLRSFIGWESIFV